MKMLKNLLDRLVNFIDENDLGSDNCLKEVKFELNINNDSEYNLKACETLINMNNMFIA